MFKGKKGRGGGGGGANKFSDKYLLSLSDGLTLNGAPLHPPRMHPVDWTSGRKFRMEDDPDRMSEPWTSPKFISSKSAVEQRKKVTVEAVPLPDEHRDDPMSFACVVHNVIDPEDCAALIEAVNHKGFTPALLNIGAGRQQLYPDARDGHRVVVDSGELTTWLFDVLKPAIPETFGNSKLIELNERCRFLCYTPGQEFREHCDGRYTRPRGHRHVNDFSRVTAQIYLHDVPEENGGATTFLFGDTPYPCQPRTGSVLLFTQNLLHEGSKLHAGLKYTLRTEAMYRTASSDDERD